jgi:hypothetical protein
MLCPLSFHFVLILSVSQLALTIYSAPKHGKSQIQYAWTNLASSTYHWANTRITQMSLRKKTGTNHPYSVKFIVGAQL